MRFAGRYQLLGRLAEGGMAELWLARQSGPAGRPVVVKRIRRALGADTRFVRLFENEAKLAERLDHPNTVRVIDQGRAGDHLFLAMEFLDGRDLARMLARADELGLAVPVPIALALAAGAAAGLGHVHTLRGDDFQPLEIVHRDISPHNLVCTFTGEVKVVDFGLATARALVDPSEPGLLKGKLRYMAPELLEGRRPDARADVYSLGAVLYELLTARRAFEADTDAHLLRRILETDPVPLRRHRPELPPPVEQLVMRALAKRPEARFPSAAALGEAIAQAQLLPVRSTDLAAFLEKLFPPQEPERRRLDELLSGGLRPAISDPLLAAALAPTATDPLPRLPWAGQLRTRLWVWGALFAAVVATAALLGTVGLARRPATVRAASTAVAAPAAAPSAPPPEAPPLVRIAAPLPAAAAGPSERPRPAPPHRRQRRARHAR